MTPYFQQYKKADIISHTRLRSGETKLGELVCVPDEGSTETFLEKTAATFVVVGIAEDIGVVANYGNPGTSNAWNSFLRSFLNFQANKFTKAETMAIIGHFSFDEIKEEIEKKNLTPEEKVNELRKAVSIIDDSVAELIQLIVSHQKVPIVVGGGHNNCYPLIKGTATALNLNNAANLQSIHCVNLDAHIDYRLPEGRHSGNGFRYAKQAGFLRKYFAVGIHENYISDAVLKEVNETEEIEFVTYEDIFIRQSKTWLQVLEEAAKFVGDKYFTGIELDLDSVGYLPSSAVTPCGITSREALQYLEYLTNHCKVGYLHICEGIASNDDGIVGKLIGYMVNHFVKAYHFRDL